MNRSVTCRRHRFQLALGLALVAGWARPGEARTVTFSMSYLECFRTTEAGEDEIYVVVAGRWKNGETFQARVPGAGGHWDLNDGEGDPPVLNQDLLTLDMSDGDHVDFLVMILEEDGGTVGGWASLAGGALSFIDAGIGSLIGALGTLFNIEDSDDFIGAVAVHVDMAGGEAFASFKPVERVTNSWDTSRYWTRRPVSMDGDGSRYEMTFEIR